MSKLKSIYEYLNEYSKEEIDNVISQLPEEDKRIIRARYGENLRFPNPERPLTKSETAYFYGQLIPRMRRRLAGKPTKSRTKEVAVEPKKAEKVIKEVTKTKKVEPAVEAEDKKVEVKEEPTKEEVTPNVELKVEEPVEKTSEPKKTQFFQTSDLVFNLLKLIEEGKSSNEICQELGLSLKELQAVLLTVKNSGITLNKKYYSDGSIKYNTVNSLDDLRRIRTSSRDKAIITKPSENELRTLVISDLHFGNDKERLDLINKAYEYCVKNGIHTILCGGDLIDGTFTQGTQKISDIYGQIEHFINNYPHDPSILTFSVAGDHDLSALKSKAIDIIDVCDNYRPDVVVGGYNNFDIRVKSDKVKLFHHVEGESLRDYPPVILHGHSHKYKTNVHNDSLNVSIPSLSDINETAPTALDMTLSFNKGYIAAANIKQVFLGQKDFILSEFTHEFPAKRVAANALVDNEESYTGRAKRAMSRTDRFNSRYSK